MYLRISEQYKTGINYLLNVDDDVINAIGVALRDFPPTVENIVYKLTEKAVETQKLNEHIAGSIISTLLSLRELYKEEDLSHETVASLITESVGQDVEFLANKDKIERFRERLVTLLDVLENIGHSLDISAKAYGLLIEHEKIFSDSRIVTDIRPVFDLNTETKIEAAILIHSLKIQYKDMEGTKEFYVLLDSDDLDNLYEQINIAMLAMENGLASLVQVKI
jgi:hypothetical protein